MSDLTAYLTKMKDSFGKSDAEKQVANMLFTKRDKESELLILGDMSFDTADHAPNNKKCWDD